MDINAENKKLCSAIKTSELTQVIADVLDSGWHQGQFGNRGEVIEFLGPSSNGSSGSLTGGSKMQDYTDYGGHGSAVCSIICSLAPNAYIHSYCTLPFEQSTGKQSIVTYINEALAHVIKTVKSDGKRHVVNMSCTGTGPLDGAYASEMHKLIAELVSLNVPVFVAAGNDGGNYLDKYPACFQEPICIVALKPDGTNARFSNWSKEADFAEVGEKIPAYDHHGQLISFSGTSGASPVAASKGIIILGKNPKLSEPDFFNVLKMNVLDLGAKGFDERNGWGWIKSLDTPKVSQPIEVINPEPIKPPTGSNVLTATQLVAYFRRAYENGWGYVWSLNGELYSRKLAEQYHADKHTTSETRDPATYWLGDCAKWIGRMAADCSGGIVGAVRTVNPSYMDRGANLFYSQCREKGPIETIPEIPGICVWRNGHIGIYEGNGYILEFRGTEYGIVRTRLKDRDFTNWGKLRDIDYTNREVVKMPRIIKIVSPVVFDPDVKALQSALNKLGYDCGLADGKVGKKTMDAIDLFCKAHGDWISSPNLIPKITAEINGKIYKGELKLV